MAKKTSPLKKPMVKAHKSDRKCPICKEDHTQNQHRFHGKKSYKKTHRGTKGGVKR